MAHACYQQCIQYTVYVLDVQYMYLLSMTVTASEKYHELY